MTANRRRKKRVRARVAKTGESYTAALRHLLQAEELHVHTYEINPAGVTDIGNVRPTNEDSMSAEGELFVVADGMGGRGRGELASRVAIDTLRTHFLSDRSVDGLLAGIERANAAVLERAEVGPEWTGIGTTLAAAAVVTVDGEQQLAVVNVGDSRVYRLREGQLERLSSDHSLVAELVRSGELSDEEAFSHPERHVLTQAVGVRPTVEPHLVIADPMVGDRMLLCSDGLFNELTADRIASVLASVAAPADAVTELVASAKEQGGNDNITVVVVDIG